MMIDVTIDRDLLLKALTKLKSIAVTLGTIPALSCVLINAIADDAVVLRATNLDVGLSITLPADVFAVGSLVVNVSTLYDVINTFKSKTNTRLRLDQKNKALITEGRSRVKISTLSHEDFPEHYIPAGNIHAYVDSKSFLSALNRVHFAATTDATRTALFGVAMQLSKVDNIMTLVSSDTFRLNLAEIPATVTGDIHDNVIAIVPKKAIVELRKMFEPGDITIELVKEADCQPSHLKITQKDTVFITNLVQSNFPNWTALIPTSNPTQVTLPKIEIINALKRVAVLSKEKYHSAYFSFSQNLLTIKAINYGTETGEEEIDIEYSMPNLRIGINVKHMQENLAVIEGSQFVLHMKDVMSPMFITDTTNDSYKFVLMPVRN